MKKRLFVVAVVLAIIFVALPVMSILAGDIFHFSGKGADAFFSSFDGCIFTDVGVFANDGRFQSPPGPGSSSSGAFIFINQFPDPVACPFVSPLFFSGFASLPDPDFRVNEGLTSARLKTTITVFDSFGSAVDANIDLTWTGTGDITREMNNFHFQSPGIIVNGHFRGSSRPAQASGSVSIGATNFTPAPSVFGQIISSRSGQVTIQ